MELYLAGASSSLYFTSKNFSGGFFLWVILPPSSSRTHKQLQRQWKIKWKSRHSQTSGRMEGQKEKRNRRVSSPLSLSIRTFLMFWVVWALRTDGGQYSVLAKPSGQRLFVWTNEERFCFCIIFGKAIRASFLYVLNAPKIFTGVIGGFFYAL